MNLINAVVRKIIKIRKFNSTDEWNLESEDELFDIEFVEVECITEDIGGYQKEFLFFKKSEFKELKEGYVFQH